MYHPPALYQQHMCHATHVPPSMYGKSSMSKPLLEAANDVGPLVSEQYASSTDDKFRVQRNWFTALYKQLNAMAKTGQVPHLKVGRGAEVVGGGIWRERRDRCRSSRIAGGAGFLEVVGRGTWHERWGKCRTSRTVGGGGE